MDVKDLSQRYTFTREIKKIDCKTIVFIDHADYLTNVGKRRGQFCLKSFVEEVLEQNSQISVSL